MSQSVRVLAKIAMQELDLAVGKATEESLLNRSIQTVRRAEAYDCLTCAAGFLMHASEATHKQVADLARFTFTKGLKETQS